MKKVLAIIVIVLLAVSAFMYYGTYSEGAQAGVVMKITKKGVLFKTWEGRLDMGTVGKSRKEDLGSKIFEFSIKDDNQTLLKQLHAAQLSGERVNLIFEQKYMKFIWDGETKYFATGVEASGEIPVKYESKIPQLDN